VEYFCKPSGPNPEAVLNYLGRYVFRIALTNARIEAMDNTHVQIRVKSRRDGQWRSLRLRGEEFLRRFVMHILPEASTKSGIMAYGITPNARNATEPGYCLPRTRPLMSRAQTGAPHLPLSPPSPQSSQGFTPSCPRCNSQHLCLLQQLPRNHSP